MLNYFSPKIFEIPTWFQMVRLPLSVMNLLQLRITWLVIFTRREATLSDVL